MSLPYISPAKMLDYRQAVTLFAKGATSLECIRSHYFSDRTGVCDLTGAKEQEEIFVLRNRINATMKVSAPAMQIVANFVDIAGADQWYQHLKEQKRTERDRKAEDTKKREEQKNASRVVLFKKNPARDFPGNKTS